MYDKQPASEQVCSEVEKLAVRVYRGLLIGAAELDIRAQLASEGVPNAHINLACRKGIGTFQRVHPTLYEEDVNISYITTKVE